MRLRVRLFAGTREAVGAPAVELDVREDARVEDVMDALCAAHPRLARYRAHALYAVDGAFVAPGATVRGRELAIMPPVSGGSGVRVQEAPFSLDALVAEVEREGAGAVVGFVGYVRADPGVERLRFEAYPEMAERELEAVRREAIDKFQLTGCRIVHRVATLSLGEPIVAVVTAAAHRRAAFEAAAWTMDELKTRVPIWKAEEGAAGARWVNDPTSG